MSAYDYNPDTCRNIFHGIADEIASSVRTVNEENVSSDCIFTEEMKSCCEQTVSDTLKNTIDVVWRYYQIPHKLEQSKSMENRVKELTMKSLIEWKKCLSEEISNLCEESSRELEEINRILKEFQETVQNEISQEL